MGLARIRCCGSPPAHALGRPLETRATPPTARVTPGACDMRFQSIAGVLAIGWVVALGSLAGEASAGSYSSTLTFTTAAPAA